MNICSVAMYHIFSPDGLEIVFIWLQIYSLYYHEAFFWCTKSDLFTNTAVGSWNGGAEKYGRWEDALSDKGYSSFTCLAVRLRLDFTFPRKGRSTWDFQGLFTSQLPCCPWTAALHDDSWCLLPTSFRIIHLDSTFRIHSFLSPDIFHSISYCTSSSFSTPSPFITTFHPYFPSSHSTTSLHTTLSSSHPHLSSAYTCTTLLSPPFGSTKWDSLWFHLQPLWQYPCLPTVSPKTSNQFFFCSHYDCSCFVTVTFKSQACPLSTRQTSVAYLFVPNVSPLLILFLPPQLIFLLMTRTGQTVKTTCAIALLTKMQWQYSNTLFFPEASIRPTPILQRVLSTDMTNPIKFILECSAMFNDINPFPRQSQKCWCLGHPAKHCHSTARCHLMCSTCSWLSKLLCSSYTIANCGVPIMYIIRAAQPTGSILREQFSDSN